MDTIFALASARGKAGVAVLRLSGPASWDALLCLTASLPAPRMAGLRRLVSGTEYLDEALVLTFAEGASFTGEQAAELHLHGATGPACGRPAQASSPGARWKTASWIWRRSKAWPT